MRNIEINLATRPFRNNTLYWAGFGSAALGLAVLSVMNVWLFFGHGSTMRQRQEEFTTKQKKQDELGRDEQRLSQKLTKLDFKGLAQQSEFANDAIRRRTFSWTRLFNRLEEVVPPSVMMTAIRPEIQAEGISVVAEGSAKDQEGLLSFEENLIRDPHFSRIYPGTERREQRGQDLRFSLKFDYVPEGIAEAGSKEQQAPPPKKEPPPPPKAEAPASVAEAVAGMEVAGAGEAIAAPGTAPHSPAGTAPGVPTLPSPGATAPAPGIPSASAASATASPVRPLPGVEAATASQPPAAPPARRMQQPGAGPRPLLKAGSPEGRMRGAQISPGREARRRAEEEQAAARFAARPLQDVFDYLMKYRSMTFVFAGDFDLGQKVTLDLNNVEEEEVLTFLSKTLDCMVTREGAHAYRLSPTSGGEPLEEPPVEEEPAPPEDEGTDAPSEPPP